MDTAFLIDIKTGDHVWLGDSRNERRRLQTIQRITPTMFMLGLSNKYSRKNGLPTGGISSDRITSKATPEEIEKYNKEQLAIKLEREQREQASAIREDKRLELITLFPNTPCSVESGSDYPQTWHIELRHLTEGQVQILAAWIQAGGFTEL